ncbi:MAG TPA: polyprenol monophosphomannose synthase [Mycobacteriales bacterium]|nr:polyprenol monophosphomannose synthase [Mycobacteriales bacterium]
MSDDELGRVLVIVPTYNEIDNLEPILHRIRAATPPAHVLIVDDASPDGTGELADKLSADNEHVHVLHRAGKNGLGAAYIAGFRWALDRDYDVMVEMDADGSHAPEELSRLLDALQHADLVVGSRYVPGGQVHNWSASRLFLSRGGNIYTRVLLGLPLRDATAGYRAYRASVLRALPLGDIASQGYCFQVDLAWRTWCAGYRVTEVPITFTERVHGRSKMSRAIVAEAFWRVTLWGVATPSRAVRKRALAARR